MNEPFSLEEINKITDFEIQKPKFLMADDKIKLAYYEFLPQNPSSVIIFYHGGGLYTNKTYQWIGIQLANKYNIASYFVDIRGHGYSGGSRGDASNIEQVWQDVDSVISFVKNIYPTLSLYLVGHSSGCGLILNYNNYNNNDSRINGFIFLSPYLGPQSGTIKKFDDKNISFVKYIRIWVYIINNLFKINFIQHIPAVYFNYSKELLKKDPLILDHYSYAMSCATTPYNVKELFSVIKKPFAIYIGSDDEQFIPEKVIEFKKYATNVLNKSFAEIVPEAKHISILLKAPDLIASSIQKKF